MLKVLEDFVCSLYGNDDKKDVNLLQYRGANIHVLNVYRVDRH